MTSTNEVAEGEPGVDPMSTSVLAGPSELAQQLPPLHSNNQSTSADDFNSLFGDNILDSLSGGSMSMEELFAGTSGFPLHTSDGQGKSKVCHTSLT